MAKKPPTKPERIHLEKVAALGCLACRLMGYEDTPAEIHHVSTGGRGLRASHYETIPLCPYHHRTGGPGNAIHAGRETWENTFRSEERLLEWTLNQIGDTH